MVILILERSPIDLELRAGASQREVQGRLAKLLLQEPFDCLTSVIVYVAFQAAAEDCAKFLRKHGINSACYHAGRPAKVHSGVAFGWVARCRGHSQCSLFVLLCAAYVSGRGADAADTSKIFWPGA